MRDLEMLERDQHEGHGGDENEGRCHPAELSVEDARDVIDRGAQVGEHDRPGQPGPEAADALAAYLLGVGEIDCNRGPAAARPWTSRA